MARLARFYGVGMNPLWPLQTPIWYLRVLLQAIDVLEAEEMQAAISASAYPYLKEPDRRRMQRRLRRLTKPSRPPHGQRFEVVEHNPQKAAEWFAAMGMRVTKRAN